MTRYGCALALCVACSAQPAAPTRPPQAVVIASAPAASADEAPTSPPTRPPELPDDAVGAALGEALKSGRGLIAIFCADWAMPCRPLEAALMGGGVGRAVARRYAVTRFDVATDEGAALATKYHVDTIPTVLVLDGSHEPDHIAGYTSDDELLDWFRAHGALGP